MIKLVTQFDRPNTRASMATPTCGCACCSCCCCCLISTIVTAKVITWHVNNSAQRYWASQGINQEKITRNILKYKIFAALFFPITIGLCLVSIFSEEIVIILAAVLLHFSGWIFLWFKARINFLIAACFFILSVGLLIADVFLEGFILLMIFIVFQDAWPIAIIIIITAAIYGFYRFIFAKDKRNKLAKTDQSTLKSEPFLTSSGQMNFEDIDLLKKIIKEAKNRQSNLRLKKVLQDQGWAKEDIDIAFEELDE